MADIPRPPNITGAANIQAWEDLVRTLQRGRHLPADLETIPPDEYLRTVQRAFLTSLLHNGIAAPFLARITEALTTNANGGDVNETARVTLFNELFGHYARDRGVGALMNAAIDPYEGPEGSRRIDPVPSVPRTFLAGAIPSNFELPPGQTDRAAAWAQHRRAAWASLVVRLRLAGHLSGDGVPSEIDVQRAFLVSQVPPGPNADAERARRRALEGDALSAEFNTAYGANQAVRYRPDGTENTAAPAPSSPDADAPAPSLGSRYTAMTAALRGIRTTADLTRFNGLLNPSGALQAGRVRLSGAVARAVQGFAVATVGGAGHMARRIQRYLTANPNDVPEPLRAYVAAVRAQLGTGVQANSPQALARIQGWLADGHAGVTTDLAIIIATRGVRTADNASAPGILTGWAGALAGSRSGRAAGIAANQIVTSGANGTVNLTPQAIRLATPAGPPPAPR